MAGKLHITCHLLTVEFDFINLFKFGVRKNGEEVEISLLWQRLVNEYALYE